MLLLTSILGNIHRSYLRRGCSSADTSKDFSIVAGALYSVFSGTFPGGALDGV